MGEDIIILGFGAQVAVLGAVCGVLRKEAEGKIPKEAFKWTLCFTAIFGISSLFMGPLEVVVFMVASLLSATAAFLGASLAGSRKSLAAFLSACFSGITYPLVLCAGFSFLKLVIFGFFLIAIRKCRNTKLN